MASWNIKQARPGDAAAMMAIIAACRDDMAARGIKQWHNEYPNLQVVQQDVAAQTLYILHDPAGLVVGGAVLDKHQAEAYRTIPWTGGFDQHVLCVHRLAISPPHQRQGLARQLMAFAEDLARQRACSAIRLDTSSANPASLAMYQNLGYQPRGSVHFPPRQQPFICLEKLLK